MINDEDLAKESVLKHFGVEFTDQWTSNADFYIYEESTADGYSVFIATYGPEFYYYKRKRILYDSDLGDALEEILDISNGSEDFPDIIYVDDLQQQFIDDAINQYSSI
jgi:hypothetical protein